MIRKVRFNPRLVLLAIIGTVAALGIGWALWGHEYGFVLAMSTVLAGSIYASIKAPISE
jgi:hypothetical protein